MTWFRSIFFVGFLFIITPVMAIICAPALLVGEGAARTCIRAWAKLILFTLKLFCGVTHKLVGGENIPDGGAIIASNHQSMWETISLFAILPRPIMVFKQELANNPVYRFWAKYAGFAIDRKAGVKALHALTNAAEAQVKAGRQIILFPEGTRVSPGERRRFQPGVAAIYQALDMPCIPVAHNSGDHWRYPGPLKLSGEIVIKILPPIAPGLKRKAFTATLDEMIATARPDLQSRSNSEHRQHISESLNPA